MKILKFKFNDVDKEIICTKNDNYEEIITNISKTFGIQNIQGFFYKNQSSLFYVNTKEQFKTIPNDKTFEIIEFISKNEQIASLIDFEQSYYDSQIDDD